MSKRKQTPYSQADERWKEQLRRYGTARHQAMVKLSWKHREEYDELYEQAKREIAEKRGPLPGGDEDKRFKT